MPEDANQVISTITGNQLHANNVIATVAVKASSEPVEVVITDARGWSVTLRACRPDNPAEMLIEVSATANGLSATEIAPGLPAAADIGADGAALA